MGTASVVSASNMFKSASAFNSAVPNFSNTLDNTSGMFQSATNFDQSTKDMVTSAVTDMSNMFNGAINYNSEIFSNTGLVTDVNNMFNSASNFNQMGVSSWTVTSVTGTRTSSSDGVNAADGMESM